jgi:hypothetical protein
MKENSLVVLVILVAYVRLWGSYDMGRWTQGRKERSIWKGIRLGPNTALIEELMVPEKQCAWCHNQLLV